MLQNCYKKETDPEIVSAINKEIKETNFVFSRHSLLRFFFRRMNDLEQRNQPEKIAELMKFIKKANKQKLQDYALEFLHKKGKVSSLSNKVMHHYKSRDAKYGDTLKIKAGNVSFIVNPKTKTVITSEILYSMGLNVNVIENMSESLKRTFHADNIEIKLLRMFA